VHDFQIGDFAVQFVDPLGERETAVTPLNQWEAGNKEYRGQRARLAAQTIEDSGDLHFSFHGGNLEIGFVLPPAACRRTFHHV